MKIGIGADEAAFLYKEQIIEFLISIDIEVKDFGVFDENPVLYPDIAVDVARAVQRGDFSRGILICGTGIGMAISANKVPGIRAAVCHDTYSTERARKSNNAQIMALGARVIGLELAKSLILVWLNSAFAGGGSLQKINKITEYENQFFTENSFKGVLCKE